MKTAWRSCSLGDVCDVIAGQSPEGRALNKDGEGLPFYQGKKDFTERHIGPPTVWTTEVTKEAKAGDILMSVRAPVGPVNFATQRICIGRGLAAIRAKSIGADYLFYLLLAKQSEIGGREGAVFASINRDEIKSIEVSVPPPVEQQRIVALLDEAFSAIAAVECRVEANRASARTVGQTALRTILNQGGDGWADLTLGEIATVASGAGFPEVLQGRTDQDLAFFKVGDMNAPGNEREMLVPRHTISEETRRSLNARLFPVGSVIFPKVGGAIATDKKRLLGRPCCVDNNVMGVIPEPRFLDSRLLYQLLRNKPLTDFSNDAGLPSIRKTTVEDWRVRIPTDLSAQRALAERLEVMGANVQELIVVYQRKIAALAELKQSILARAFTGELTREPLAA